MASGLSIPWHIRRGPTDPLLGDQLLVTDQGTGTLFQIDAQDRPSTPIPLATGLLKPAGLAYDAENDKIYVSENQRGQVVEIDRLTGERRIVVTGLATPEGVALDATPEGVKNKKPTLLVVEARQNHDDPRPGRLLRFRIPTGKKPAQDPIEVIATGLPTKASGALPTLLDYTADVLVRSDGRIVVTGTSDGSLILISRQ